MKRRKCFVIMPFSETSIKHSEDYWTKFFDKFLKPIVEKYGYVCERSKALPTNLVKNIIQELYEADLVVAVLTDYNSNVWYELGIRHSLKEGTIMMIEKGQKLPFDTTQYGVIQYNDIRASKQFITQFESFIESIEKSKRIDNPVHEFLVKKSDSYEIELFSNFNSVPWQEYFKNCKSLDIYVHYFDTFIRSHQDFFKSIFLKGGIVRLILPNYQNNEIVSRIKRRFPEYTVEEIAMKIKHTKHKIASIKKLVKNTNCKFQCIFTDELGYYCGLKFNNDKLIISLYDHIREKQKIESPTILLRLNRRSKSGEWFDKEFNKLFKQGVRMK